MNKIPMLERFAAQSLVEHEGELIFSKEKFAELIVEQCVAQCWTVSEMEHKGDVISECSKRMRKHFGVEESRHLEPINRELKKKVLGNEGHKGWVCPKCGIDRTKEVCPLGHMAAIEGKCPMTAEAQ